MISLKRCCSIGIWTTKLLRFPVLGYHCHWGIPPHTAVIVASSHQTLTLTSTKTSLNHITKNDCVIFIPTAYKSNIQTKQPTVSVSSFWFLAIKTIVLCFASFSFDFFFLPQIDITSKQGNKQNYSESGEQPSILDQEEHDPSSIAFGMCCHDTVHLWELEKPHCD